MIESLEFKNGRELSKEDLLKIAELDYKIPADLDPSWDPSQHPLKDRIEFYDKLQEEDFFTVVFYQDQIVGFHILKKKHAKTAGIVTLWVAPEMRKQGIAKVLKEMGKAWAKDHGFQFLETAVHVRNTRMLEINEESGFEVTSVNMRLKL